MRSVRRRTDGGGGGGDDDDDADDDDDDDGRDDRDDRDRETLAPAHTAAPPSACPVRSPDHFGCENSTAQMSIYFRSGL